MSTIQHRDLSGTHVHSPITWRIADEEALNNLSVVEGDEGKLAWVESDNSVHLLLDGTIGLWTQLGAGTVNESDPDPEPDPEGFDDGSAIDGLTFEAMEAAGNYDPNTDTGYFGEVSSSTLFTGPQISDAIGLTAGTAQHSTEGWLKFYVGPNAGCNRNNGEPYVIYIAKKPYRHTVSWDAIYARGAVYGTGDNGPFPTGTPTAQDASVTKNGKNLIVRLMTGVKADPTDLTDRDCALNLGENSEWNELMYRVHQDVPVCPNTSDGGPQVGDNWETFTNADLVIGAGDGRATWTQETNEADAGSRVNRGNLRLSVLNWNTSSLASSTRGFRPCLVLP